MHEEEDQPGTAFGLYMRQLRGTESVRKIEARIKEIFPHSKSHHVSQGYILLIEKGKAPPPSPDKLAALARAYGVDYKVMLYHAGYLPDNPLESPKDWPREKLRDFYFSSIMGEGLQASATRREGIELLFKELLLKINYHPESEADSAVLLQALMTHYFQTIAKLKLKASLTKEQMEPIHKMVENIIETFPA